MADNRTSPLNQQLQDIFAAYQKADLADKAQAEALRKQIAESSLPAYHKDVLLISFFDPDRSNVPTALYLLRKQEELRHAEALLRIESAALGERAKRDRGKPR